MRRQSKQFLRLVMIYVTVIQFSFSNLVFAQKSSSKSTSQLFTQEIYKLSNPDSKNDQNEYLGIKKQIGNVQSFAAWNKEITPMDFTYSASTEFRHFKSNSAFADSNSKVEPPYAKESVANNKLYNPDGSYSSKRIFRKIYEVIQAEGQINNAISENKRKNLSRVIAELSLRFPKDSALFFVAIGMVMYGQLWTNYGGNPLAMAQHMSTVNDPIANIAFASFIMANGLYNFYYIRSGKLATSNRVNTFRVLNYKGLAAGMLASNLISELGLTFKTCASGLLNKKNTQADSLLINECGESLRMWHTQAIVTRYTPILVSLLTSQAISELLMNGVRKTSGATADAISVVAAKSSKSLLFEGLKFNFTYSKAGQFLLKTSGLVGTIVTFAAFIQIDHLILPWIKSYFGLLFYKPRRWFNESKLDECFEHFANGYVNKWRFNSSKNKCYDDFAHTVSNWRDFMNDWRATHNYEFENGYLVWVEMLEKILKQYSTSQLFYLRAFEEMRNEIKSDEINKDKKAADGQVNLARHYTRISYLNGVLVNPNYFEPKDTRDISELSKQEKEELIKNITEEAFDFPDRLLVGKYDQNSGQISFLKNSVKTKFPLSLIETKSWATELSLITLGFCMASPLACKSRYLKNVDEQKLTFKEKMIQIKEKIEKGSIQEKAYAIYDLGLLEKVLPVNSEERIKIKTYREYLGNPQPLFYKGEGFPWLISQTNELKQLLSSDTFTYPVEYDGSNLRLNGDRKYKFNNGAYYLLHEMICGKSESYILHSTGFQPDFYPPRILDVSKVVSPSQYDNFCQPTREGEDKKFNNMSYTQLFSRKFNFVNNETVEGPMGILKAAFDPELLKTKKVTICTKNCAMIKLDEPNEQGETSVVVNNNDVVDFYKAVAKELNKSLEDLNIHLLNNASYSEIDDTEEVFSDWWMARSTKNLEKFLKEQDEYYKKSIYSSLIKNINRKYVDTNSKLGLIKSIPYSHFKVLADTTDAGLSVIQSLAFEMSKYVEGLKSISRTDQQKKFIDKTIEKYQMLFSLASLQTEDSYISKSKTEEKKQLESALQDLELFNIALTNDFTSQSNQIEVGEKDKQTFLALKIGLDNVNNNLKKYLLARHLVQIDQIGSLEEVLAATKSKPKNNPGPR